MFIWPLIRTHHLNDPFLLFSFQCSLGNKLNYLTCNLDLYNQKCLRKQNIQKVRISFYVGQRITIIVRIFHVNETVDHRVSWLGTVNYNSVFISHHPGLIPLPFSKMLGNFSLIHFGHFIHLSDAGRNADINSTHKNITRTRSIQFFDYYFQIFKRKI